MEHRSTGSNKSKTTGRGPEGNEYAKEKTGGSPNYQPKGKTPASGYPTKATPEKG